MGGNLVDGTRGEGGLVVEVGDGLAPGATVFVDTVEEGKEAVVVFVSDGVEFVRMALGTSEGESEPDGAGGVDPVDDVVDAGLLGIATTLAVSHVIPMKAGRENLVGRGIG